MQYLIDDLDDHVFFSKKNSSIGHDIYIYILSKIVVYFRDSPFRGRAAVAETLRCFFGCFSKVANDYIPQWLEITSLRL